MSKAFTLSNSFYHYLLIAAMTSSGESWGCLSSNFFGLSTPDFYYVFFQTKYFSSKINSSLKVYILL